MKKHILVSFFLAVLFVLAGCKDSPDSSDQVQLRVQENLSAQGNSAVGMPSIINFHEKRILKACGRAEQVVIYTYNSNSAIWWNQIGSRIDRAKNLTVINIASATSIALSKLSQRNMQLQCTVQDGQIWVTANDETVEIDFVTLKAVQAR